MHRGYLALRETRELLCKPTLVLKGCAPPDILVSTWKDWERPLKIKIWTQCVQIRCCFFSVFSMIGVWCCIRAFCCLPRSEAANIVCPQPIKHQNTVTGQNCRDSIHRVPRPKCEPFGMQNSWGILDTMDAWRCKLIEPRHIPVAGCHFVFVEM